MNGLALILLIIAFAMSCLLIMNMPNWINNDIYLSSIVIMTWFCVFAFGFWYFGLKD